MIKKTIIYMISIFLLVFAVACAQTTTTETTTAEQDTQVMAAQLAPSFEVETISGRTVNLAQNVEEERPTVVYFMASWCPTCAKNWEALNEVVPLYEGEVDFVAVSIDPTDTHEVLDNLAQDKGFMFDSSAGNPQLATEFKVQKQTEAFAVNSEGEIVEHSDGEKSVAEWTAFFEAAKNN